MFKYSSIFIIVYIIMVSIPMIELIINKKDIEDNIVVFMFIYITVPLFAMMFEYMINQWIR